VYKGHALAIEGMQKDDIGSKFEATPGRASAIQSIVMMFIEFYHVKGASEHIRARRNHTSSKFFTKLALIEKSGKMIANLIDQEYNFVHKTVKQQKKLNEQLLHHKEFSSEVHEDHVIHFKQIEDHNSNQQPMLTKRKPNTTSTKITI